MGLATRLEKAAALTTAGLTLTFTSGTPSPAATQIINNGASMTDAETGQFAANVSAQLAAILVDLAELRRVTNAGE